MSPGRVAAMLSSALGFWGAVWLVRTSQKTAERTAEAVESGGTFEARLTGYWPFTASEAERKMEGGLDGAAMWRGRRVVDPKTGKRVRLHTLEQHLDSPSAHPFVAISADPEAFPFGQRIQMEKWPDAVFRVVDTGGHFKGASKVYRALGKEPLDVCVDSKSTKVPSATTARVVRGDHYDKPGEEIAVSKFQGQRVTVGGAVNEGPSSGSGFDVFGVDPLQAA